MEFWPSTRVTQGGIFHPRKVVYSKETHDLIKCKQHIGSIVQTMLVQFSPFQSEKWNMNKNTT